MARKFPDLIRAYMDYSKASEAPDRFHFWTAVSMIGGACRRCVWVDQINYHWTPNFYIVFVAPPGIVSKSTTAKIGMNLLKQVPDVTFGPSIVTWQALIQAMSESQQNVTIDHKIHPMSAITISSSEFGSFLNTQDREMIDVLVDLWDGQIGVFEKMTKTSGNDQIVNPWINVIACTTPDWIASNFPEYMIGGGFVARTIFVYAEKKRHLAAYVDELVEKGHKQFEADLVHDLKDIAKNCKGAMTLTEDARAWGRTWYEKHNTEERPAHLQNERMATYLARKQAHLHKLAIVLSVSQSNDRKITAQHLAAAEAILEENEKYLPKVFAKIGDEAQQKAGAIVSLLQGRGPLETGVAYSNLFHTMSYNQFKEGLESALRAGLVVQKNDGGKIILHPTYKTQEEGG